MSEFDEVAKRTVDDLYRKAGVEPGDDFGFLLAKWKREDDLIRALLGPRDLEPLVPMSSAAEAMEMKRRSR